MAHVTDWLAGLGAGLAGGAASAPAPRPGGQELAGGLDPFERALEVLGGSLRNELHRVALSSTAWR